MPWESRRNGQYYYRKRKEAGRVVSEYVGSGLYAKLAELQDDVDRIQRIQKRKEMAEFKQMQRRIDEAISDYGTHVRQVVTEVLQTLGYHLHRRQWRKARKMTDEVMEKSETGYTDEELKEYCALYNAVADKGKDSIEVKRLSEYAKKHPALFEGYWMMASATMDAIIDGSGAYEAAKVHYRAETISLKRSLGSQTASPLEILLIDDIALCWLRMQFFEQIYTRTYKAGGVNFAQAQYLEKRLSATRRRYLQAIESLARVRGLLSRAGVQVNIAQNQVVQNG